MQDTPPSPAKPPPHGKTLTHTGRQLLLSAAALVTKPHRDSKSFFVVLIGAH